MVRKVVIEMLLLEAQRHTTESSHDDGSIRQNKQTSKQVRERRKKRPVDGRSRQVRKSTRWMPWHREAMKDAATSEMPWGAGSRL